MEQKYQSKIENMSYWCNLGDWCTPGNVYPQNALVHTFYYWMCQKIVAESAFLLGKKKEGNYYREASERTKAAFHKRFYDEATHSYGPAGSNIFALYMGVPEEVRADVIETVKKELAEMKGTSAKKAKAKTTGIDKTVSDIDMVRMDQNKPNPFSESTVIALNIPQEAQTANIYIYDMSGKQVQSLSVSERGETNITVYASDITPGMYIYTLVVDGKVAVTRRMIVSEI